jgi:hypothetical protein
MKKHKRIEYSDRNVIYILTTEDHIKRRLYIIGKDINLKVRLGSYNKTQEHEVVYYKACKTEEEAIETVKIRSIEQDTDCHYEKVGDYWIVYRTYDRKVMKNINYFRPDLKQFLN